MIQRTLLVGGDPFDRVNDNDSIEVVQHSRAPTRGTLPCCVQFSIPFRVRGKALILFHSHLFGRPPGETARTLVACDLADHFRQAGLQSSGRWDADRHLHGAGRQPRLSYNCK